MSRQLDAALERGTVTAVLRMMNDTHVGQLLDEPVADLARAIFAAVVHHNDLKSWSIFGTVRYASSTTAGIFASSLNAGSTTDNDFMIV